VNNVKTENPILIFLLFLLAVTCNLSPAFAQVTGQLEGQFQAPPLWVSSPADAGNLYLGQFQRGLYPGGSNTAPAGQDARLRAAVAAITKLNTSGTPSAAGWIILSANGFSNQNQQMASVADTSYFLPGAYLVSAAGQTVQAGNITSVSGCNGTTCAYNGTFASGGSNAYAGAVVYITGLSAANNTPANTPGFLITGSSVSALTVANPKGVNQGSTSGNDYIGGYDKASFGGQLLASPLFNSSAVLFFNGCQPGQTTPTWVPSNSGTWGNFDNNIMTAINTGAQISNCCSNNQVQVSISEEAFAINSKDTIGAAGLYTSLPTTGANSYPYALETYIGQKMRSDKTHWPNLRVTLELTREAGNACMEHAFTGCLNPEPYAYETGYAVKWAIGAQIAQMASELPIVSVSASSTTETITVAGNATLPYGYVAGIGYAQISTTSYLQVSGVTTAFGLNTSCTNASCPGIQPSSVIYSSGNGLTTIVMTNAGASTGGGTGGHVSIIGYTHDGYFDTSAGGMNSDDGITSVLAWGPYIWQHAVYATGPFNQTSPTANYSGSDGTHEAAAGQLQIATDIFNWFTATGTCSPYAAPWLLAAGHC